MSKKLLTRSELGYIKKGKEFKGWTVWRESDGKWMTVNDAGDIVWSNTVAAGYKLYLYKDGASMAKTVVAGNAIHMCGQWMDTTDYLVYYHEDVDSDVSPLTTRVTFGVNTKTLTISELGFSKEGKTFAGWIVNREGDGKWMCLDSSNNIVWAVEVPEGGMLYNYKDGVSIAKTAVAGNILHFYGCWEATE